MGGASVAEWEYEKARRRVEVTMGRVGGRRLKLRTTRGGDGVGWPIASAQGWWHGLRSDSAAQGWKRSGRDPVVCLQLVDLLAVDLKPEIFADELDDVQRVGEARPLLCVPLRKPLPHLEADRLDLAPGTLQLHRRRGALRAEHHLHQLHVEVREACLGDLLLAAGRHAVRDSSTKRSRSAA